jgi:NarL family two-component system response regulator LiaR
LQPYQTKDIDKLDDVTRHLLSNREKEIVFLVKKGNSNQDIADQLFISVKTVEKHMNNIYKKLSIKNRFALLNLFVASEESI